MNKIPPFQVQLSAVELLIIEACLHVSSDYQGSNIKVEEARKGPLHKHITHTHKKSLEKRIHETADALREFYDFKNIKG